MDEKSIKKLSKLLSAMDENSMTTEEFLKQFKMVLEVFLAMKAKNEQQMTEMKNIHDRAMKEMDYLTGEQMAETKQKMMDYCRTEMNRMSKQNENELNFIRDKVRDLKDGKDADEEKIVEDVLAKIKLPEQKEVILDNAEQLRDKLETLEGEEKLRIEAINGLEEILDELKKRPIGKIGGGFSVIAWEQHIVDDETPSGTINGVTTDFTLANIPSPTSSLKVFVNGQRMRTTTDYTFSGKTISFLTAPPEGSILLVDYRV